MSIIILWIKQIVKLPHFLFLYVKDLIKYIKFKEWLIFQGWGLHLYVGVFGAGKTSTMVRDAFLIAKRYPQVTILSNFKLVNFPAHTSVLPLTHVTDILDAPPDTLVLIDEIGTIFNSRDFMGGKGVPKLLFQHICQCRKRHIQIFATTQRWNFLDKQLRDITATVTSTRMCFRHPFSRMATCKVYDAVDYDLSYSNPAYSPTMIGSYVYIQTNKIRNLYDTTELVETILSSDYVSDSEVMANRGENIQLPVELSKKSTRRIKKNTLN